MLSPFSFLSSIKILINQFYILTKEGRKDGVEKIREELKKAIKKERYLSKEDAKLINQFIRKIRNELRESSD